MNTFDAIYIAVSKIPKGYVTTYGRVAEYVGINNPRIVGYAMHSNKTPTFVPCHRVVSKYGGFAPGYAFGGLTVQKQLLQKEGIAFIGQFVNLKKHLYTFSQ